MLDSIELDYTEFKENNNINSPEVYLSLFRSDPNKLVNLFIHHCENKLIGIKHVTLHQAMETIGEKCGNVNEFILEQFNHLFRMSSALWSFDKGKLGDIRQSKYDKIINLGVYEQEEGKTNYNKYVTAVKGKYRIRSDHSFSTTADPYRIWILNFAAALPVYFLSDMEKNKKRYESEISPTYHIDKDLEMNVPDIFPVDDITNRALRTIGMAIVPGINVVRDEKLPKGHKFIFDDSESIKAINFGEPKKWYLFRDMYEEVIDDYNPLEENNLLDMLSKLLKEKVESMPQDELRKCIVDYIQNVERKLDSRDFSKLISARLTYREVKSLAKFLDPHGYKMDINRYINGKL